MPNQDQLKKIGLYADDADPCITSQKLNVLYFVIEMNINSNR